MLKHLRYNCLPVSHYSLPNDDRLTIRHSKRVLTFSLLGKTLKVTSINYCSYSMHDILLLGKLSVRTPILAQGSKKHIVPQTASVHLHLFVHTAVVLVVLSLFFIWKVLCSPCCTDVATASISNTTHTLQMRN